MPLIWIFYWLSSSQFDAVGHNSPEFVATNMWPRRALRSSGQSTADWRTQVSSEERQGRWFLLLKERARVASLGKLNRDSFG